MKRVIMMGDTHCGSRAGLTPPGYQETKSTSFGKLQRELWRHYKRMCVDYSDSDVMLFSGDAIDGKGFRSGGTELITSDRLEQAKMAADVIAEMKPKQIGMVHGTPYHTGVDEDFEYVVAKRLQDKYGIPTRLHSWLYIKVEGIVFHMRHKVGGSSRPHTAHSAPAGEALGVKMWEGEYHDWPQTDITVRGHRHKASRSWTTELGDVIVLPALQAAHTKFGGRSCMSVVDWGVWPCIVDGDSYSLDNPGPDIIKLKAIKPDVLVIQ